MNPYNGFSGAQRMAAQKWLNEQWAAGTLKRPSQCVACGQTHGPIDAHAEDYSQPFAAGKTDQYHLCYACHMMIHCRFRNRERFVEYRQRIAAGERFNAAGRSWKFIEGYLQTGTWVPGVTVYAPHERDVLAEIAGPSGKAFGKASAKPFGKTSMKAFKKDSTWS